MIHSRQTSNVVEPLEPRRLLSVAPVGAANELLNGAASLGVFHVRSHAAAHGAVGEAHGNDVYSFDVTTTLTLNVTVGSLRQNDTVTLFFPNGSMIVSMPTGKKPTVHFKQELDPGTYYVDIAHGDIAANTATANTASAARVVRHRKPPANLGKFVLAVAALKANNSAAPQQQAEFAGFSASASNGPSEPTLNATFTPAGATYQDFSSDPLFGPNGPSPDDIIQGGVGDCYYLATLSAIARVDPGLIEQDVQSIGNGQYKVKFESSGKDVFVTVDGQLPVDSDGNTIYDHLPASNAIWVAIMEKAFCYFRNPGDISYAAIEAGTSEEVLNDFGASNIQTGAAAATTGAFTIPDATTMVNQISVWQQAGQIVVLASNPDGYNTALIGDHAYSVVGITADGQVEVRNPWGVDPTTPTDANSPTMADGGYLTLDPTTFYNNVAVLWTGLLPDATPTPAPTPPPPAPTPVSNPASVSGTVYNDVNDDQMPDPGDPGLAGWTVYATTDANGSYAAGDPSAVTDSSGNFTITGLTPGATYYVAETIQPGYIDSSGSSFHYSVTPAADDALSGYNFGEITANPTPSQNQTLDVTPDQYADLTDVIATLGSNASTLDDNTQTDVFVMTGVADIDSSILVSSDSFAAEIEVVDFSPDGQIQNIATAGVTDNNDLVSFHVTPGDQYEVLVGSADGNVGDYIWNYFNTDLSTPEQLTPAFFNGTLANSVVTAPSVPPIAGTIFAGLPSFFGDTPVPPTIGPSPAPGGTTLILSPTTSPDVTEVEGNLGANASVLGDGTQVDTYVTTALTTGQTAIAISSPAGSANAEIEVIDFNPSGSIVNVTTASSTGSSNAEVSFQVTAGDQYEVLIATTNNAMGNYGLDYFNTDLATPEQLAPAYFSSGGSSGIITAPGIAPISGQIFAALPSGFGSAPLPQGPASNQVIGNLGPESFTLDDGTVVDAYNATANSSTYTTVSVDTQSFVPQIEIAEFAPDGTQSNFYVDANRSGGSSSTLSFPTTAGNTYEIVVGSKNGATGSYTVTFDPNVLTQPTQILPS